MRPSKLHREVFKIKKVIFLTTLIIALFGFSVSGCDSEEEAGGETETAGEEDANSAQMEGDDGFEELKPQLEQQLRQEKEQELLMQHLEDLEEESDVEKYPEAIEEGTEGTIVAQVDDEEIYFEQYQEQEEQQMQTMAQQGLDPESPEMQEMMEDLRPQILNNLINNVLLEKQVEEEDITVSEEDIDEQYQVFAEQAGGQDVLEQQLEEAELTEEELRGNIAQQLKVQTYISDYIEENLNPEELEFSEEELRELYEEIQQQQQMEVNLEENN